MALKAETQSIAALAKQNTSTISVPGTAEKATALEAVRHAKERAAKLPDIMEHLEDRLTFAIAALS